MNKTELIAIAAEHAGMTKKDSERVINAAIDAITQALVKGEKVQLSGFGTFETKDRACYHLNTSHLRFQTYYQTLHNISYRYNFLIHTIQSLLLYDLTIILPIPVLHIR